MPNFKHTLYDLAALALIVFGVWFTVDGISTHTTTEKTAAGSPKIEKVLYQADGNTKASTVDTNGKDATKSANQVVLTEPKNSKNEANSSSTSNTGSTNAKDNADSGDKSNSANTSTSHDGTTSTKTAVISGNTSSDASSSGSGSSASSSGGTSTAASTPAKQETVSVTVRGYKGTIASGTYAYNDGDTAFTMLETAADKSGFSVNSTGSGATAYVKGINGQNEGDKSSTSGWKYTVNGKTPSVSAGAYKLKAGDKLVWYYAKSE
ncbi:DUF4430 domain-containing protein [Heyndrickxia acidiproducens]|uniref:DUF4430 domain-containing protein n=1 Tax=Heyndrickxia acidiproducens TaxID=1121084 RepID=UPI00039DD79E|nr:DUF4430 domain-containing protein [Heyndrickxia acidiproducens]